MVSSHEQKFSDIMTSEGYRVPYHKLGARLFSEVAFPKEMTVADIGRMTILSKMMIPQSNMLGYRSGKKILPYIDEDIAIAVGLATRPCKTFIRKMIKLHVLHRAKTTVGDSVYIVNPAYFMSCGQRLTVDMFVIFQKDLAPLLPDWVILDFVKRVREKQV